jgi:hypothetical protein
MPIEVVKTNEGATLAIVLYGWESSPGTRFFTEPKDSLQLGCIHHRSGHRVEAHTHKPAPRTVTSTAEVLFIQRGRARIEFYGGGDLGDMSSREVKGGDIVLLLAGGHGLEMLEETVIFEVKQGPFLDDKRFLLGNNLGLMASLPSKDAVNSINLRRRERVLPWKHINN